MHDNPELNAALERIRQEELFRRELEAQRKAQERWMPKPPTLQELQEKQGQRGAEERNRALLERFEGEKRVAPKDFKDLFPPKKED
jgi:hypothetical protein